MKRSLFILLFVQSILFGFNQQDFNRLLNGDTDLSGADLKGINVSNLNLDNVDFSNADLSQAFLQNCSFVDANLNEAILINSKFINCELKALNVDKINNLDRSIFIRSSFNDGQDNVIRDKGGFIPNKSLICNADLHVLSNDSQEINKKKHIPRMIEAANNPRNNVQAFVLAGDLCDWGDRQDWDDFVSNYYNPLQNTGKEVLLTAGNHDRWQREETWEQKLNVWGRAALGLGSVAIEEIKDLNSDEIFYKKYLGDGMDVISLGECPTMSNKYNEGTISWYKNLSHKYPEIIFFHYNLMTDWSVSWWTMDDEPIPNDLSRGRSCVDYFDSSIKNYKDRIALMITGHYHSTYFENWRGIPVVNVGGPDRFALCHFYINKELSINNCIAVELIHHDSNITSNFYYPCLQEMDEREVRAKLLKHFYRICLRRDPDVSGLNHYLDNWYKYDQLKGISARICNSAEAKSVVVKKLFLDCLERDATESDISFYVDNWDSHGGAIGIGYELMNSQEGRPIVLRDLYLDYLKREPDESGFNYYLDNWENKGGLVGIEDEIQNSAEARTIVLKELFLNFLQREPTESDISYYLNNWDSKGGASGIENELINSQEGRPIALRELYLDYLKREPDEVGLNYYLDNWDSKGGLSAIENEIKNSTEAKIVIVKELFLLYLERGATESDISYYLDNWDSKGGASGIENELINSQEGRPIALNFLYSFYLDREPTAEECDFYLNNWIDFGYYSGIAKKIYSLKETRLNILNNLFRNSLDRNATLKEQEYYLFVWDYIGGSFGIEEELKTYYKSNQ